MSAAELDSPDLEALAEIGTADHLSFLLGAGASVAAGLPSWDQLATDLLLRSEVVSDAETAQAFLAQQDPLLAAEAARAGANDWSGLVRAALYPDGVGIPAPAALHLATAGYAAERAPNEVSLLTLNFDDILERAVEQALADENRELAVFSRFAASPRATAGNYEVHHLHGLLGLDPRPSDDDIVLTLSDFAKLSGEQHPWQASTLQECLQRGPLLLAGTSHRDPDMRQWLHELHDPGLGGQGVVALQAREGIRLTRDQFERVRQALVDQWSAINVTTVLLHDHSDAAQAIREMRTMHELGYQSPKARVEHLLRRHLDEDFLRLQREHSECLAEDLERLRPHLGEEANLTLWLADGAGHIVRWAANDRVYHDPGQLRRVPVGYDSPWVAGQCLGREDTMARDLPPGAGTQRWGCVVAAPLIADLPDGPPVACAALSSAAPNTLESRSLEDWVAALSEVAASWEERLSVLAREL